MKSKYVVAIVGGCIIAVLTLHHQILQAVGSMLIEDTTPSSADAAVVLNTGVEYYPRLLHAAELYRRGITKKVIINGNRKSDILRSIEKKGFSYCCPWYQDRVNILQLYGVPKRDIITISVEDAFDTISEAAVVGNEILLKKGIESVVITTSKYHTRRAGHIWRKLYSDSLTIYLSAATDDPFNPQMWWKSGRQFRLVLTEFGAWVFYFWYELRGNI